MRLIRNRNNGVAGDLSSGRLPSSDIRRGVGRALEQDVVLAKHDE
jgi:hypothetical protein